MNSSKYYSADLIYTNESRPLVDSVIEINHKGRILGIHKTIDVKKDVKHVNGALVPGFINCHTHLELSHLYNKFDTGTGLIQFIQSVLQSRDAKMSEIKQAISAADTAMYHNGIVAVGDISNTNHTLDQKVKSPIYYHTFIELFDLWQSANAQAAVDNSTNILLSAKDQSLSASFVPHATYSVSDQLFALIKHANSKNSVISIHNQETKGEGQFLSAKSGPFKDFYKNIGVKLDHVIPNKSGVVEQLIDSLSPNQNTLLVHNTMTTKSDIEKIENWSDNVYWVSCPNANLFIENQLPDYQSFIDQNAKMCLGTDSLASNWQLSIFEEIRTIQKYNSYIPTELLIQWSSYYGARALNLPSLGSIEVGKSPGLVHLEGPIKGREIKLSHVKKLQRLI